MGGATPGADWSRWLLTGMRAHPRRMRSFGPGWRCLRRETFTLWTITIQSLGTADALHSIRR
eukprot:10795266-Prorocentrum_lima.AAC.1